jgi:hypothetical protein
MTAEVIGEMRAIDPTGLDDDSVAAILKANAPWINDPQLRSETEQLWKAAKRTYPSAFDDCGCNDHHRH